LNQLGVDKIKAFSISGHSYPIFRFQLWTNTVVEMKESEQNGQQ
jgi:hypothetical protein